MTQETKDIQYLILAREKFSKAELDDARACYEIAFSENPENPEAKYFHNFYSFIENYKNGDIEHLFEVLVNSLEGIIKYVAEGDLTSYERSTVIFAINVTYLHIPSYIIAASNNTSSDLMSDCIVSLYWLGSYIQKYFNEDSYYMERAIEPWKKAIELQQEYGCKLEDYKAEDYVEKIKKIDPQYIMPENALEKKAIAEAEKKKKQKKDLISLIIAAAIFLAIVIVGGVLPNVLGK